MALQYWQQILHKNPTSAEEFMQVVFEMKPDINEHDIVRWQRASRDWTTDIFEFIWFHLKIRQGETRWIPQTEALWPNVKSTLDAEKLQQLLKHMSI